MLMGDCHPGGLASTFDLMKNARRRSMIRFSSRACLALVVTFLVWCQLAWNAEESWFPARVLITNDNGIDDPKIVALARAFARRSEVWVVAPAQDRSGSGSLLTVTRAGGLEVQARDLGEGIRAFAVDGYPADCVILAATGLMRDHPPDLVVSGINGGANLGIDWMFSGTVGAARVAAVVGFRSIAVSGLDDDLPGSLDAAVRWVVALAGSPAIRDQRPGEYLTVSMPRALPAEIRGIRVTDRAPPLAKPKLAQAEGSSRWTVVGSEATGFRLPPNSDQAAHDEGYIAVVPMRVGEVDHDSLSGWLQGGAGLPAWRPDPASVPQ